MYQVTHITPSYDDVLHMLAILYHIHPTILYALTAKCFSSPMTDVLLLPTTLLLHTVYDS